MIILNALKQLRDDIKTWVTVNLNALNAKIDEKTIPIDSELDSTSSNSVQNQAIAKEINSINDRVGDTPVATQISNAIDKVPTFSGDYNDLTNAPDISEDGSGNMVITDESGNIIFKADADGIHTTAVSLNGETAASEKYVDEAIATKVDFTGYATEEQLDNLRKEIGEGIESDAEDWKIVDEAGNIIFRVDKNGAHTTSMTLDGKEVATKEYVEGIIPEVDLTGYATEEYVDDAVATAKNELSESIESTGEDWKVVDGDGNIIFSVDNTGAHTTNLTLNGEEAATKTYVDEAIGDIKLPETDFTGYATEKYVDDALNKTVGKKYINESGEAKGEIFNDYENNTAAGLYSHAEGLNTSAAGEASHAEGYKTSTGFKGYSKVYYSDFNNDPDNAWFIIESTEPAKYYSIGDNLQIGLVDGSILKDKFKIKSIYEISYNSDVPDATQIELSKLTDEDITIETADIKYIGVYNKPYGDIVIAEGAHAHAEGNSTQALGEASHSEGKDTRATGNYSHAEGWTTVALGGSSHSEGSETYAAGGASHAEGYRTEAIGENAHAEGQDTHATGNNAHTEGQGSRAEGIRSHAEGFNTFAIGEASHTEGYKTFTGFKGYSEVYFADFNDIDNAWFIIESTEPAKYYSIGDNLQIGLVDGSILKDKFKISGIDEVNFGSDVPGGTQITLSKLTDEDITISKSDIEYIGVYNKPCGDIVIADGYAAHSEGGNTLASGDYSHAGGLGTIASEQAQAAIGKYNAEDSNAIFIVGNGESNDTRSNAFIVNKDGFAYIQNNKKIATEEYVNEAIAVNDSVLITIEDIDTICGGNIVAASEVTF